MGNPKSGYPHPGLDCEAERRRYEAEFAKLQDELRDVEFVGDVLVSSAGQLAGVKEQLRGADGILAIQFTGDVLPAIREVAALGRPTMFFAAPYSGHEWNAVGAMRRRETGQNIDAVLTSDFGQLAAAIRPFRAIHHLREAKILNLSTTQWTPDVDPAAPGDYAEQLGRKFGTEIKRLPLKRMLAVYDSISDRDAQAETDRWIAGATAVVEPSRDDVFKSCKLALAFERILDEEDATSIAVDCYESMWRKLPAYPCIPFSYLNNLGLGGICQSDLQCATVHTMLQGLTGRPGFIGNSMFDFAKNAVVLVHCTCTTKMDGPDKPAMPYKLRGVAERRRAPARRCRCASARR